MGTIRNDTAKQYRNIRKILHSNTPEIEKYNTSIISNVLKAVLVFTLLLFAIFIISCCAQAEDIAGHDVNKWANAIYKAEGGKHTRHPYGVLANYKHTTPRQACINTIRHQYRNWIKKGRPGAFVAYLGHIYCPVGAFNDPMGLNRNWIRNVSGAL
jgi:hypothetical protein